MPSVINKSNFLSNRGQHSFSLSCDQLRSVLQLGDDFFTEIDLSANSIRDITRRILDAFGIPIADLKIFLREDRDARVGEQLRLFAAGGSSLFRPDQTNKNSGQGMTPESTVAGSFWSLRKRSVISE